MGDRKHLQYAIMKYLEDEAKDMSEDQRESLEGILFWFILPSHGQVKVQFN